MIGKLKGRIDYLKNDFVVLDVNGVGYKVYLSNFSLGKIAGAEKLELYIHTHVREETLALYGFLILEELEMFEQLISVSGVGPRSAMGILSIADPQTIRTAIISGDSSLLTRVSGVGKRTAERVIVELKNKVADISLGEREKITADSEVFEALVSMGYSKTEAREALKSISKDVNVEEKIKIALKSLGKK